MKVKTKKTRKSNSDYERGTRWKFVDYDARDDNDVDIETVTLRLRIPGGWLYRCREWDGEDTRLTMTFVPDPKGGAR